MTGSPAVAARLPRRRIVDVHTRLAKLIHNPRPRSTPKALGNNPPVTPPWISTVQPRRFGWSVLALSFVSSTGVQVFLAVSMNVTWPLPVATAAALMAGGCVVAALRER